MAIGDPIAGGDIMVMSKTSKKKKRQGVLGLILIVYSVPTMVMSKLKFVIPDMLDETDNVNFT